MQHRSKEVGMTITTVSFAREHVQALKDLVPEQEVALIRTHPNILR